MIESRLTYMPLITALRNAADEMADKRPLMRSVAGIMFRAVEDNFQEEGRPKWVDLHPGTKLQRYKAGTWPGQILQRSGGLASSIQQRSDSNTAVVGTNKIYGPIHQFGGKTKAHVIRPKTKRALAFAGIVVRQVNHPGSRIPARPFLRLTPRDLADIIDSAHRFHLRAITRRNLSVTT